MVCDVRIRGMDNVNSCRYLLIIDLRRFMSLWSYRDMHMPGAKQMVCLAQLEKNNIQTSTVCF